jgi:hypothetical protein
MKLSSLLSNHTGMSNLWHYQRTIIHNMHWERVHPNIIYVATLCSPITAEPIISPTDVVMSHFHLFHGWAHFAHYTTG